MPGVWVKGWGKLVLSEGLVPIESIGSMYGYVWYVYVCLVDFFFGINVGKYASPMVFLGLY